MKNQIINNITQKDKITDPVLEVEKWKDATDNQIERMSPQELNRFYAEAVDLVQNEPENKNKNK